MKITIAKTAGFCMGVHRAVDLAVETSSSDKSKIFSLGPLIHNRHTLDMLSERGVTTISENDHPEKDSTVIIRAHGIPPEVEEKFKKEDCSIIDGTCPKVKTVHKVITKYKNAGFNIIITGDKGHAEVIGLMGYAGDSGCLISTVEEVGTLGEMDKICLVSQTTFSRTLFDDIKLKIEETYKDAEIVIRKTICAATDKRQLETVDMAKEVDALVVVGGKNSANTIRLAEISNDMGTPTFHIESEEELKWKELSDFEHIGITAGASTPNWMIKRVSDHITYLNRTNKKSAFGFLASLLDVLAHTNIFAALGGASMYFASCILQGVEFSLTGASLAFLYMMSIYLWNSLTSIESSKHLDIGRYRFYNKFRVALTVLALGSFAIILTTSFFTNSYLFYLTLLLTAAGSAYQFSIVPKPLRKIFKYSNLKDIPASRELFAALAWSVLTTFIPHAIHNQFVLKPSTIAFFLWSFFLAYLRSLIFDLRDIEGDRIMGRETLITVIGEKSAKKLIFMGFSVSFFCIILFSGLLYFPNIFQEDLSPIATMLQIPVLIHMWFFMKWQHKLTNTLSPIFNVSVDGQFYIAAFFAWLSMVITL